MIGIIKEIRTDADMETDNPEPEIYCDFYEPVLQADKERLQKEFDSEYYALDGIIMAPSMIVPIREGHCDGKENFGKIYLLQEDWSYDGDGQEVNSMAFTSIESAFMFLRYRLYQEAEDGSISSYQNNEAMQVDEGNDWYEIYLEGFYNDDHYNIRIIEIPLVMSESYYESLKGRIKSLIYKDDLIEQICDWEETAELSESQYNAVINDETLLKRMTDKLLDEDEYWESYYRVLSEVGFDLIREHSKKENRYD